MIDPASERTEEATTHLLTEDGSLQEAPAPVSPGKPVSLAASDACMLLGGENPQSIVLTLSLLLHVPLSSCMPLHSGGPDSPVSVLAHPGGGAPLGLGALLAALGRQRLDVSAPFILFPYLLLHVCEVGS